MLNAVDDLALERGWLYIDETATPGLIGRVDEALAYMIEAEHPRARRRLTWISHPMNLGGASMMPTPEMAMGLGRRLSELLNGLENKQSGLLLRERVASQEQRS